MLAKRVDKNNRTNKIKEIVLAINNGQIDIIDELDDVFLTDEILSLALEKGYHIKKLVEKIPYSKKACLYLSKYFNFDFSIIDNKQELVEVLKGRFKLRKELFAFLNVSEKLETVNIDTTKIIKFCLGKNEDLDYLNLLIIENRLDEFLNVYVYVKNNFFSDISSFETYSIFLKCAYNYYKNSKFYNELIGRKLNAKEIEGFYKYFKLESNYYAVTIDSLEEIGDSSRLYLEQCLDKGLTDNCELLKEQLIKYLFGMSKSDYKKIYIEKINISVLKKIKNNTKNAYLKYKIELMEIVLSFIEDLQDIMSDNEKLIKFVKHIINNDEKLVDIRRLLSHINEDIREIYEMDANECLSNLDMYPDKDIVVGREKVKYIDLDRYEYAICAHVYRGNNIEELVNPRLIGKQTLCVSAINELSQEYCFMGVTVGYTYIPNGNFIASSNKDLLSEFSTDINSIKVSMSSLKVNQLSLRELANQSSRSSEILLYREGMIPSCIIMRGMVPTSEEVQAAKKLTNSIRKIPGYENYTVRLVKAKQSLIRKTEGHTDITLNEVYLQKIKELNQMKSFLLQKDVPYKIRNISFVNRINKKVFYATIDDELYLVLSVPSEDNITDSYLTNYKVRNFVNSLAQINMSKDSELKFDSSLDITKLSLSNIDFPSNVQLDENCEYVAIKAINNCTSYDHRHGVYTRKEILQFILEAIIDYLLGNIDVTIKEFYYDASFNIYRINKVKNNYVNDTLNNIEEFNPIYTSIIDEYDLDDEILELCKSVIESITSLSDEEYLAYFRNHLNYDKLSNVLKRKNSLVGSFDKFINERTKKLKLIKNI